MCYLFLDDVGIHYPAPGRALWRRLCRRADSSAESEREFGDVVDGCASGVDTVVARDCGGGDRDSRQARRAHDQGGGGGMRRGGDLAAQAGWRRRHQASSGDAAATGASRRRRV